MMRTFVLLAVLAVTACTDLPSFEPGQCGNGVIDRNEDCDGGPDCTQCSRTCETDADCAMLPGQYLCGVDQVCHAPSGVFGQAAATTFPFVVGHGTVGDLDGDRIGDIVGFSDITIDTRFGDPAASLTTRATQLLPYSNAQIALRTFDRAQGTTDILVPTPDGIAAYTATASKALVAYPFANDPGARGACASGNFTGEPIASFAIGASYIGFVVRNHMTDVASIAVLDLFSGMCTTLSACGLMAPDPDEPTALQVPVAVDHYEPPGLAVTSVIAVGVPISMAEHRVCAVRFSENGFSLTPLTPTPHAAATGPITLARATAAGACPALYTGRLQPSGLNYYAGSGTAGACALSPTSVRILDPGVYALPTGRIPLQPAIAGMGADALVVVKGSDFTASTEIYSLNDATTISMYTSARPLARVHAADLDGDGTIEAVATAFGGPQGEPDLDILYRAMATFVPYRISTQSVPTHLELGDFDGNNLHDIAYTERLGTVERLMVAYGTRDRPLPAVEIAKFANIVTLNVIDVPDSIDPGGLLDDLLVVDEPEGLPLLTILHGNPQRSMLAYYDPRGPVPTGGRGFVLALAGNFDPTSAAIDVLALEEATDGAGDIAITLWLAAGTEGKQGLANQAGSTVVPSISAGSCSANATLCSTSAEYLVWPLADRDIVLALEGPGRARRRLVTIATNTNGDGTGVKTTAFDPDLVEPFALVFGMFAADVDGDHSKDLLVAVGRLGMIGPPVDDKVLDCKVGPDGVVQSCTSIVEEVEVLRTQGWVCRAAERGILSARGRHDDLTALADEDVVVLCNLGALGRVFRLEHATGAMVPVPILGGTRLYEIMSAGDVNGDRLIDLIGISFDPISETPIINVHLQCDARDVLCRNENSFAIDPVQE